MEGGNGFNAKDIFPYEMALPTELIAQIVKWCFN